MFLIKARMQVALKFFVSPGECSKRLRHTLLLYQLEPNIITRTRVKPLRGYSGPRVSEAFSVAWMQQF